MKYEKRISLKNIALELGVSINTVSRALRDCDDISETTKEKVRRVAIELGYLPNSLVYSISNGKTRSVALVINNVRNYYFSIINDKLLYYLRAEGYLANIVCLYGNSFDSAVVKECLYQRVDTVVTFVEPTKDALEFADVNHIHMIVCGRKVPKKHCDALYTNDEKGGAIAANYLLGKGAKNFVYINVRGSECSLRRFEGFRKQLLSVDPTFKVKKVNIEDFDDKLAELQTIPNLGVFAYNDEHLFIISDKLRHRKIDWKGIPYIGYDAVGKYVAGTIKTPSIGFDYDAMARECVRLIKRGNENGQKHSSICFDVHLEDV